MRMPSAAEDIPASRSAAANLLIEGWSRVVMVYLTTDVAFVAHEIPRSRLSLPVPGVMVEMFEH
jgi:hypothetical protein